MDDYEIYITAIAAEGAESPEVRLERLFGLDRRRAHEFMQSLPRVVKRGMPFVQAERYASALREIGAVFELRRSPLPTAQTVALAGPARVGDPQQQGGSLSLDPPAPAARAAAYGALGVSSLQPNWLELGADKYELDVARASAQAPASHLSAPFAEEAPPAQPYWRRFGLRAVLGTSLLLSLIAARQWFGSGVDTALARWGSARSAGGQGSAQDGLAALGPVAAEWMESDLHQFSAGDKDRVSGLVGRFKGAGAREVYVGAIMRSGALEIAGELIVELPEDAAARGAVLAVHAELLEATFGQFAPRPADPGGDALRVTL